MALKSKATKVVAGFVGVAMALSFVVAPSSANAATQEELQAQIASLLAMISQLQAQLGTGGSSTGTGTGYSFTTNLQLGSKGEAVKQLQIALNADAATRVALSGAGSPGMETTTFGPATRAAVMKFQAKYGISTTGTVGPLTRAKLNSLVVTTNPNPGTTPTTPTTPAGTGLMIAPATQPAASLAPESASRVPFTKVTLTASNDGDVTVNSLTVERGGLAQNAVFDGIVLLDENGTQIGIAKTLNSNNQAVIGEPFVVKRGTSKTVTVAGNMAATLDSYAGQVALLSVVAVNTSATVSGSLPITGAGHTINASLAIGSMTTAVSSFDPNTSSSKEIGTTNYKFSGVRITAGSAEKLRLWSVRFNQAGSASLTTDLANLKVNVDGTDYPVTISADGKYVTASFGGGIVIDKGLSKDIYITGDIVGGNAAGRTVRFDIANRTDLYATGETYGYGITAPAGASSASDSTSEFTAGTPWFHGSLVTVTAGTATTIGKATSVASQNVAINVPNQVLGGYETDIKGEPITVQSSVFNFTTSVAASSFGNLTNVTLVDSNGAVVAGPVDATTVGGTNQKVTFTDTITYPVGKQTYTLKGKIPTTASNGSTIIASTTPSSDWSTVRGVTTGNTITLTNGQFAMNTMTVRGATLAIAISSDPAAQTIVPGGQSRVFANVQLDATQSGEDVRFSSIPLTLTLGGSAAASSLSSCQLYDGTTVLNSSSVVSPSSGSNTFTFDQSLVVPKGTIKTLTLKCNVSASASTGNTFAWGIASSPSITVTGVTSGSDVSESVTASTGQTQTIGAGSFTVTKDSSSPSYQIAAGGATNVTGGVLRFAATNEAVDITRVALQLSPVNGGATSTPSQLTKVSLWDGATKVGEATFIGASRNATSTLTQAFRVAKDSTKLITIKVDLSTIGSGANATSSGHLIEVDYDGADSTGTQGTGVDSGTTINTGSTSDTDVDGIRVMKAYPVLARLSIPNQVLSTQSGVDLYRFSVTANGQSGSDGVSIYKFTVDIATSSTPSGTSSTTVTNLKIMAYTDSSFSSPVSGFQTAGQINSTVAGLVSSGANEVYVNNTSSTNPNSSFRIPTGSTYYFKVVADIALTGSVTSGQVITKILGDSAYPDLQFVMDDSEAVDGYAQDDFIWSPNSTTTSATSTNDWTNGYFVPGLPSDNMDAVTISK